VDDFKYTKISNLSQKEKISSDHRTAVAVIPKADAISDS
jgi:hypothetical protein